MPSKMTEWKVEVTAEIPYPWMRVFFIKKSNAGAAVSIAIKEFRKAVKARSGRAKRIEEFQIKVSRAKQVQSDDPA